MSGSSRLADVLEAQTAQSGIFMTPVPGVALMRADAPLPRSPFLYGPSIMVVAQGRKRVWLGDESFDYDADNYLVLAVPMPMDCETMPLDDKPLLALVIAVDPVLVGELLLEIGDHPRSPGRPSVVGSTALTVDVMDAATRLAAVLETPLRARVLGPQIVREIVFHVLEGEKGDVLRLLAVNSGRYAEIARVLRRIDQDYAAELDVASLAREAHMSVSTFHQVFREMTATSPLQYIKQTRLHKARALLVDGGVTAQEAAHRVGYASASQFGREYRRMFGVSPASDKVAVGA
ncbi:MAG: AraC family transcriptional regulator [Thermoleophilia bacterium]